MDKFLSNKKFFIFFLIGGLVISIFFGIIFRNNLLHILIRGIISSLVIGAVGLGLDIFLVSTIGEEEYNNLFSSTSKNEKTSFEHTDIEQNKKSNFDIREELTEEENISYEDILNNRSEEEKIETPKEETKKFDFSSVVTNQEEVKPLFEEENKKEETKKSNFYDGDVSFQVKNKKITTTPEVVAKAIKTILQRDED